MNMKINKAYIAVGLIIAFSLIFELAAHADGFDQATTMTFNQPVQIPGRMLPAGTYLFKSANRNSDLNTIQVFNADRTVLYATVQTIGTERQQVTGDTEITLAEQGSEQPDALVKWFYPGRETGHEFLYSREKEKELAQDRQETVVANDRTPSRSDATGAGN